MSNKLKYYYDLMSQPSRAMYIILKLSNVPFEDCPVALREGEHLTEEFKSDINRFQKVPCINDNGFKLSESIAILRYLHALGRIPDSLYPLNDVKLRANIDEYLEWQHLNVRATCALYFRYKCLDPKIFGKTPDPKKLETFRINMDDRLDLMENIWLKSHKFIASDHVTVADIFAACEILQPTMADYDPTIGRPRLKKWLENVREATNPFYDEAHEIVYKVSKKSKL